MENTYSKFLEVELQCTICLELSVSPIHSCQNGHIICGICSDKVNKCGICRNNRLLKNGLAERLAQKVLKALACTNFESGCKISIKSTEIQEHLLLCEYRPIRCNDIRTNPCRAESFEMREYLDHLKSHHKTPTLESNKYGEFKLSWLSSLKTLTNVFRCSVVLCEKNGQYFLVHSVFGRSEFCLWMTFLGGQTEADKYYYTTQLTSTSKNIELTLKLPVLPVHKFDRFEKVVNSGQYVSLSYKMILAVQENPLGPNEDGIVDLGLKIQTNSANSNYSF